VVGALAIDLTVAMNALHAPTGHGPATQHLVAVLVQDAAMESLDVVEFGRPRKRLLRR
jgi:hypothetical protein